MTKMRIATPCAENLDAMPRAANGDVHCTQCDRDVVDLRRATQKRALAVIQALRAQGDGKVCVRVRAHRDGTPVFAAEPASGLARFAMPLAMAGAVAACAPSAGGERDTTPVVALHESVPTPSENGNGVRPPTAVVGSTTTRSTTTPTSRPPGNVNVVLPEVVPMAGGLAFSD